MTGPILIVFVIALLLAVGAAVLLLRSQASAAKAEMALRLRVLGEDADAHLLSRAKPISNPVLRFVTDLLTRSGVELEPERVGQGILIAGAAAPLLLILLGPLAGLLAIGLAIVSVFGVLSRNAAKRRAKIVEQLPSFLEAVMRVLSAGNTLEESLGAAARDSPEPIRPLFISIGRQIRLGAAVESVLAEAGEVHRLRDLKVIALAAAINRKYGGSLRQVLKSLISTIRSRDTAARELRALTAETRFSALVLAIIPVSLSLYIFTKNKGYYAGMWADPSGRIFLIASVLLQITGVAILWKMMNSTGDPDA
ncbi:MAG: type II secretion system F family protein [Pseudomonadota bacterium]